MWHMLQISLLMSVVSLSLQDFFEGVACTDEDDTLKSGIESWVLLLLFPDT